MLDSAFKDELSILLVEDTASDAALIRARIEAGETETERFLVTVVSNLAEAREAVGSVRFDAVLLDLMLPDSEGLDGLAGLQALAPDLPIVILTGRDDEDLAERAVLKGAQDYLFKDKVDGPSLLRVIRRSIHRKRHLGDVVKQANYDGLTGLPNRSLFMCRLETAMARQQRVRQGVGVLMLDLNGFKAINDSLGHDAGDAVLREIGQRIPLGLRPYDVAARLGGDEFVILIEDARPSCDYVAVAEKLIEAIERPMIVSQRQVSVGVSIGIARAEEGEDIPADVLLRRADQAMYSAKARGGSGYAFWGEREMAQPPLRRVG